jgi:hypothetical protein
MAQNRMAAALKEWQKRADREKEFQRLSSAQADRIDQVPVVGRVSANVEPKYSLGDRIHDLSVGIGRGLGEQAVDTLNMIAHPVQTARTLYDAARSAITNPSATARQMADALRKDYGQITSGNMYDAGETLGKYLSLRPKPRNVATSELDVYHGTPHRFPATEANPLGEFDASKIGTGEGAQAYGHGVYYAENPEVAKGYQPRDPKAEAKLMSLYKQAEARQNYDAMEVLEAAMLHRTASELREQFPKQKGLVTRIGKINEKAAGSLYHADLPDEMIDRMLDWDKPPSEQPKQIRDAINKTKTLLPANAMADLDNDLSLLYGKDVTPNQFLNTWEALSGSRGSGEAALRQAGIPGIKYLDAGSRGQDGSGTRNFVVFPGEEKKVKILERK